MKRMISLRINPDLYDKGLALARKDKRSFGFLVEELLEHKLKGQVKKKAIVPAFDKPVIDVPNYIDGDKWLAFIEVRDKLKAPNTERAIKGLLSKLAKFNSEGMDVNAIIDESVQNGWKGVFAPKGRQSNTESNVSAAMEFING